MTTELMIRFQNAVASLKEERGAAMAEYGLLLALVALAAIAILVLFGEELVNVFTEAEQTLENRGAATTT